MPTDEGRKPEKPRVSAKTKNSPSAKVAGQKPGGKRSDARKLRSGKTMKKVGRTIRAGSATTVLYTRKAVNIFNAFTHSPDAHVNTKLSFPRKVAGFFATMSFPTFILISLMIVVISVMGISNTTISIDRQTLSIAGLPKELEGFTILHLSDLHGREFGNKQQSLLKSINAESYNLALFTGDMVGASGNAQPLYDLLEGLSANRPRFFIPGDSDPEPLLRNVRDITGTLEEMVMSDWALGAQQRGATMLQHTTAVKVNNQNLWLSPTNLLNINITETIKLLEAEIKMEKDGVLAGVETDLDNLPLNSYRYQHLLLTQQASSAMKSTDIHIALAHIPPTEAFMMVSQQLGQEETIAYLPTVDLVLAGHYCGGVWKLPLIGALYIPNTFSPRHGWFPSKSDVQGPKTLGHTTLYTTAGLGVTDKVALPNFRLLNAPQVSLITLTAAITDNLLGD